MKVRYELQYRSEVAIGGVPQGLDSWRRYGRCGEKDSSLEDLRPMADVLRQVYVNVRIIKISTTTESVE